MQKGITSSGLNVENVCIAHEFRKFNSCESSESSACSHSTTMLNPPESFDPSETLIHLKILTYFRHPTPPQNFPPCIDAKEVECIATPIAKNHVEVRTNLWREQGTQSYVSRKKNDTENEFHQESREDPWQITTRRRGPSSSRQDYTPNRWIGASLAVLPVARLEGCAIALARFNNRSSGIPFGVSRYHL